ncbi:hypothetical protein ACB092_05G023800 [Castanea dentata]
MWKFEIFPEKLRTIFNKRGIQVLVTASLLLQFILLVAGYRRKFSTSNKLIFFLWITYLLEGWVTTVSLSLISNSLRDIGDKARDAELVMTSFWAPFFLVYLGGPDTITAYSLEDNMLWRRQAVTLVSQVFVAIYVVIRAWANKAINFLTIPMLIPGIIKIGERIWVLRSGSSENFKASKLLTPDPGPSYARYMEEYNSKKEEGFEVMSATLVEPQVVPRISFPVPANAKIPDAVSLQCAYTLFKTFKQLFSDLILSIQDIKNSQSFFRDVTYNRAFQVIEMELGFMYDVFYTKAYNVYSRMGSVLRLISFSSIVIVFVLFVIIVDKDAYLKDDITITYVLLDGAIIFEIYSVLILLNSDWSMLWMSNRKNAMVNFLYKAISSIPLVMAPNRRWSNTLGQYNLIRYCLKHEPAKCGAMQRFLFHYELLEKHRYQESEDVSDHMKSLIFEQLLEKLKSVSDLKACTELCDCRGERVLKNSKCPACIDKEKRSKQHQSVEADSDEIQQNPKCIYEINQENLTILQESVEVEFDQSILLWHIATNLCYHSDWKTFPDSVKVSNCQASKLLSDYMLYLLVMRPIMLPNGIAQIRFQDTCAEAIEFFKERKSISNENQACLKLLEVNTEIVPSVVKGDRSKSVLFDACRLAKSLLFLETQKKWELISHVWVEILCYAATKCRWNHHAQQLGRGGELLTHVWLLMAHLGITEQFQISKGHARAMLIAN